MAEEKLDIEHEDAERFYTDIRCGILHSGETKNFSCLSIGQDNPITPNGRGAIKVDVKLMADRLRSYYSDYCAELRDGKDHSLRVKFIRKMDSITKKWENHQNLESLWNAIRAQQGRAIVDSSQKVFFIESSHNKWVQLNNRINVLKSDISDAVNFWDDKDAINVYDQWKYIVPLFEACREEADKFIIRAG